MVRAHAKAHRRAWAAGSHAILATPERLRHVGHVIIGGFARVIRGIDAHPRTRPRPLRAGRELALARARRSGRRARRPQADRPLRDDGPRGAADLSLYPKGELKIVPELAPATAAVTTTCGGRRQHEPIGRGLRSSVASIGDLARSLHSAASKTCPRSSSSAACASSNAASAAPSSADASPSGFQLAAYSNYSPR